MLLLLSVGARALAADLVVPSDFGDNKIVPLELKQPKPKPFKLKGAGQLDLATFTLDFSGTASAIGKYVGTGQVDPATFQIQGNFMAADEHHCAVGEQINFTAAFTQGPLGDIVATFTFVGGTGRFTHATGSASGPVVLDPDYTFTINVAGTITY